MEIELLGQIEGRGVLVLNQAYLHTMCSSFFLPSPITPPLFMVIPSLYSPTTLHLSTPPINLAENSLDDCPIRTSWKLC